MTYFDFQDLKLSALGMGAMRFPTIGQDNSQIDEKAAAEIIDLCMKNGINYYDTAWVYHGGNSETLLGKLLSRYPRESYYLATKFPGFDSSYMTRVKEIFNKQLEKCGVDYFDFYLFHNVNESKVEGYLDPANGIVDYLVEQKKLGRIRHLGFSAHGEMPVLKRFMEACGEYIEFCQLQVNYVDWTFQHAKEKIDYISSFGIPVWVMEPVRGGKLAKLSPEQEARLKALRPDESIPAWAFRFLQSIPNIGVTLSGMSNTAQLMDNLATYSEAKPLNENEMAVLLDIAQELTHSVPCTACSYCTEYCPQGLDLPNLIHLYNEHTFTGHQISPSRLQPFGEHLPNDCIACGSCAEVCPQNIAIPDVLQKLSGMIKP